MKIRVVQRGDKFLAQYKDGWFIWITVSESPMHNDYPKSLEFDTQEEALDHLKKRFETKVVYEGEI